MEKQVKVLIVDESEVARTMLSDALSRECGVEVVGIAPDSSVARNLLLKTNPDVLTLDIEMPQVESLSFLSQLIEHRPTPVIILSSSTRRGAAVGIEALRQGAVDVIVRPDDFRGFGQMAAEIASRVRALGGSSDLRVGPPLPAPVRGNSPLAAILKPRRHGLMLLGASTGGTQAIEAMLTRLPAEVPPILIVQHMPSMFTKALAEYLDKVCLMRVVESAGEERLEPGVAYIAPGGRHFTVQQHGATLKTVVTDIEPADVHRGAVDVLFHSAAALRGVPVSAAILTGTGQDGAAGLLALRQAGATTFAEDERSSVAFEMPANAIAQGAASRVATLLELPRLMLEALPTEV